MPRCVRIGLPGRLERALRRPAAGDGDRVPALGAALGDEQVPPLADPVEVRPLGELAAGPLPERAPLAEHRAGDRVDATAARARPGRRAEAGVGDISRCRRRPTPGRGRCPGPGIRTGSDHGPAGRPWRPAVASRRRPVRGDHPEPAVVVPQRRREDAAGRGRPRVQLGRAVQDMTDLLPRRSRSSGRSARRARTRSWSESGSRCRRPGRCSGRGGTRDDRPLRHDRLPTGVRNRVIRAAPRSSKGTTCRRSSPFSSRPRVQLRSSKRRSSTSSTSTVAPAR